MTGNSNPLSNRSRWKLNVSEKSNAHRIDPDFRSSNEGDEVQRKERVFLNLLCLRMNSFGLR